MTALRQNTKKRAENSYKTWMVSWLRPTPESVKVLLTEGKITFSQAIFWLAVASIFYATLTKVTSFYIRQTPITSQNAGGLVGNIFVVSVIQLIGYFLLCGSIHLVAKLFKKNGDFQNYFIAYSFFTSPSIAIYGLISLSWYIFHSYIGVVVTILFQLYYLFWLNTIAIETVYKFHRVSAFFINVVMTAILAFILYTLYIKGVF